MPHAAERWTAARVRALPDDGNRYELVSGELVVTATPASRHQVALRELAALLLPWLGESGAGHLLTSPADLSLGEEELLQPDLFVYPAAVGPAPGAWAKITSLLLAIEILSPSTARYDRQLKRRRYQRAGVAEYWIVDLDARLIERWRPDDIRPEMLGETLRWQPAVSTLTLEIDLVKLFEAIWHQA